MLYVLALRHNVEGGKTIARIKNEIHDETRNSEATESNSLFLRNLVT